MKKIQPCALLVFPPVYDFALFDLFVKPYSLLKIGKWLLQHGYRISILNCLDYQDGRSAAILGRPKRRQNGTGKFNRQIVEKPKVFINVKRLYARYGVVRETIIEKIREQKPDIILISSGMTYWYPGVREVVEISRHLYPKVPIVIGGVYATLCRDHAEKEMGADAVIAGAVYPLLSCLLEKLCLPAPNRPPGEDLLIDRDLLSDSAVVRMNRGCPFRCAYCASHRLDGGFHGGSWKQAWDTVRAIHTEIGTRNFAFYDDALLSEKERGIMPFLEAVISAECGLSFYTPNGVHLAYLDKELCIQMRRAGFREVRIGLESSDARFHGIYDKKLRVDDLAHAVEWLKSAGFLPWEIGIYIMVGFPAQTRLEVVESIRFLAQLGVRICIAEYSPVPGTELWKESVAISSYPLEEEPLTHNNSILPLKWKDFTERDLVELKELAWSLSAREKA